MAYTPSERGTANATLTDPDPPESALQSSYSRPPLARHKRNREKKRARSRSR